MNILLGITGSVSAYKTPWLVRDLRRAGHDVRVVMTPSAREFVTPLALEATSLHPVIIDPYAADIQEGGSWHVHLGRWADVMLIAPCSATTLSRLATGLCDTALMGAYAMEHPKVGLPELRAAIGELGWADFESTTTRRLPLAAAAGEYERAAYGYGPNPGAGRAGYAALVAYDKAEPQVAESRRWPESRRWVRAAGRREQQVAESSRSVRAAGR